jgi:hypothetical protein
MKVCRTWWYDGISSCGHTNLCLNSLPLCRCWLGWVELCIQSWRLGCQTSLINDGSWVMIHCYGFKAQASACAWNTATRQRCDMNVDKLTFCFNPHVQHAFCWTCSSKVICEAYIVYWLCICLVSLVLRLPCHTFSVCFEELDIAVNIAHKFSLNKSSEGYQRQNWCAANSFRSPWKPSKWLSKEGSKDLMTSYDKIWQGRFGFVLSSLGLHVVHVCRSLIVACRETPMFSYRIYVEVISWCHGCYKMLQMQALRCSCWCCRHVATSFRDLEQARLSTSSAVRKTPMKPGREGGFPFILQAAWRC